MSDEVEKDTATAEPLKVAEPFSVADLESKSHQTEFLENQSAVSQSDTDGNEVIHAKNSHTLTNQSAKKSDPLTDESELRDTLTETTEQDLRLSEVSDSEDKPVVSKDSEDQFKVLEVVLENSEDKTAESDQETNKALTEKSTSVDVCELKDKEGLICTCDSNKEVNNHWLERSWPCAAENGALVNFLEIEDKDFENGDFCFFLKESDTGQVRLYLKYFINDHSSELVIPEGEFGKLFTMEWKDDFISESSEDLGHSLQNCLVSLEDSVDKLRWENVVASMGPFHHGSVRLKQSLMAKPGNSGFGGNSSSSESALPKHVFNSQLGYNGRSSNCDRRHSNGEGGASEDVFRSRWQNASYRSAVSSNSQGKSHYLTLNMRKLTILVLLATVSYKTWVLLF